MKLLKKILYVIWEGLIATFDKMASMGLWILGFLITFSLMIPKSESVKSGTEIISEIQDNVWPYIFMILWGSLLVINIIKEWFEYDKE